MKLQHNRDHPHVHVLRMLKRIGFGFLALLLFLYGAMLTLSVKRFDVAYGVSFNQEHARSLGLDWKQVYEEILNDLQPEHIRIAAMWNDVEPEKGVFNFSSVDFMMNEAATAGTKVLLVVGQKAPRWPECHVPKWFDSTHPNATEHINDYLAAVVLRYKNHPALYEWQVENEPYIRFRFGDCAYYNPHIVPDEIALVRRLDPKHKIVLTDSGELGTWYGADKYGEILGTTMYRKVRTPKGKIINYGWLPSGYYRMKAALWNRSYNDFIVAELQAEPWFTGGTPLDTPINIQEKTMNPHQLMKHFDYVERAGASRAYLWGVEWWYFMKTAHGDARYWELVKTRI